MSILDPLFSCCELPEWSHFLSWFQFLMTPILYLYPWHFLTESYFSPFYPSVYSMSPLMLSSSLKLHFYRIVIISITTNLPLSLSAQLHYYYFSGLCCAWKYWQPPHLPTLKIILSDSSFSLSPYVINSYSFELLTMFYPLPIFPLWYPCFNWVHCLLS